MSESSLGFNFDDFDAQIAEVLEDNELHMQNILRPGQIGGVPTKITVDVVPTLDTQTLA